MAAAPKKLTSKQEAFCHALVSGMTQVDAYRSAYSTESKKASTCHEAASRLVANSKITARIAELRRPVMEKLQYGLEEAMLEAEDAMKVSKSMSQGAAMIAAVTLRARLNGLLVDKKEVKHSGLKEMSSDELDQQIERTAKELGVKVG